MWRRGGEWRGTGVEGGGVEGGGIDTEGGAWRGGGSRSTGVEGGGVALQWALRGVLAHGQALCRTPSPFCLFSPRPRGGSLWGKARGHNGAGSGHCWPPSRRMLGEEAEPLGPLSVPWHPRGPGRRWGCPLRGLLTGSARAPPSQGRELRVGPSLVNYSVI